MRSSLIVPTLIVLSISLLSCRPDSGELIPIQEQRSDSYIVTLLNDTGIVEQRSTDLTLEFRDASTSEFVDVDDVQVQATMPMPGMAPMFGELSSLRETATGRYEFDADLSMVGGWNLVVTFDSARQVQFSVRAQ